MPLSFTATFSIVPDNGARLGFGNGPVDQTGSLSEMARQNGPLSTLTSPEFWAGTVLGSIGVFVSEVQEPVSRINDANLQFGVAAGEFATGVLLVGGGIDMAAGGGGGTLISGGTGALVGAPALVTAGLGVTAGVTTIKQSVDTASQAMEMRGDGNGGEKAAPKEGIYEFKGKSGKDYVGQSKDLEKRLSRHESSGKMSPSDKDTVQTTEVPGGKTAREIAEQKRINEKGGIENLENERNPIDPKRQHLLEGNQHEWENGR